MSTSTNKPDVSLGYLALIGAIAGGGPSFVLSTATLADLVGNAFMGALMTVLLELFLLRKTLAPEQMRRGRLFLILMLSMFLSLVTYRPATYIFQTVFGFAPPRPGIANLSARTIDWTSHGGTGAGYRLAFNATSAALQTTRESMDDLAKRAGSTYQEFTSPPSLSPSSATTQPGTDTDADQAWKNFVTQNLPPDSPLLKPALDFTTPQGWTWTSKTPNGGTAKTTLLYDAATNLAVVEHRAG